MSETEEPGPETPVSEMTLSTKVDADTYEWFKRHAEENFRNLSGQLAYVIHRYREQTETRAAFVEAIDRNQGRLPRPIRVGRPYVAEPDPNVSVVYNGPGGDPLAWPEPDSPDWPVNSGTPVPGHAVAPDQTDDDPEEGVA